MKSIQCRFLLVARIGSGGQGTTSGAEKDLRRAIEELNPFSYRLAVESGGPVSPERAFRGGEPLVRQKCRFAARRSGIARISAENTLCLGRSLEVEQLMRRYPRAAAMFRAQLRRPT